MATCQGCGQRVEWKRNVRTGKAAPVDPLPTANGNVILISEGYRVLTKKEITELDQPTLYEPQAELLRYTLHFATCPNADHYRRCGRCHHTPCTCST